MKLVALLIALCVGMQVSRLQAQEPVPPMAKKLTYQEYVKLHEKDSKVAKIGEPFMIDDEMSVEVRGQVVSYDGLDRGESNCSFVVRYMNEKKVGKRVTRNPIISIKSMERLEGAPKKAVAGDIEIGEYTVHILSANDKECRYLVESEESSSPTISAALTGGREVLWGEVLPPKNTTVTLQFPARFNYEDVGQRRDTLDEKVEYSGRIRYRGNINLDIEESNLVNAGQALLKGKRDGYMEYWSSVIIYTNYVHRVGLTVEGAREIANQARKEARARLPQELKAWAEGKEDARDPTDDVMRWSRILRLSEEDWGLTADEIMAMLAEGAKKRK